MVTQQEINEKFMEVIRWLKAKGYSQSKICEKAKIAANAISKIKNGHNNVGDETTYQAILANTYDGDLPLRRDDGGWLSIYDNLRILKIAGINHRTGIDRYVGRLDCALVPEPNNKYDPNAIQVLAEDSHCLGYVSSYNTEFVRSLADDQFPMYCTAFIDEHTDEYDGHKFFTGYVYIVKRGSVRQ